MKLLRNPWFLGALVVVLVAVTAWLELREGMNPLVDPTLRP
jgi:hypothetical protein